MTILSPDEEYVEVSHFDRLPPIVQDKVIFKLMEASEMNGIAMSRPRAEAMAREFYFRTGTTKIFCKISEADQYGEIQTETR